MASKGPELPLLWRIHNLTCPAWNLNVGFLKKIEPGCRAVQKRLQEKQG